MDLEVLENAWPAYIANRNLLKLDCDPISDCATHVDGADRRRDGLSYAQVSHRVTNQLHFHSVVETG